MRLKQRSIGSLIARRWLVILLLLSCISVVAVAQAKQSTEGWLKPLNLSQSAGTSDPQNVVDVQGRLHVIWMSRGAGFYYSRLDVSGWSSPVAVEFPFGTRRYSALGDQDPTPLYSPALFSDQSASIHALWLDSDSRLFYSRVNSDNFASFDSWLPPQQLADVALNMRLTLDNTGIGHLVYIRPVASDQFPAGLYYRQTRDGGLTWSPASQLYASAYFQNMVPEKSNVQIATMDPANVVISWEDPLQETIATIHSGDRGVNWDAVEIIDNREENDTLESLGPRNMSMAAVDELIMLTWQAGHLGAECDRYYQISDDGGSSWQPRLELNASISECSRDLGLLNDNDGDLLLFDETDLTSYISLWDGSNWSDPSAESILTFFTNPETFRNTEYSCKKPAISGSGSDNDPYDLIITGCELNRDIWVLSIDLATLRDRIGPASDAAWQRSEYLATTSQSSSIKLVGDQSGRLHAFWTETATQEGAGGIISYSRWDGETWSSSRPVLSSGQGQSLFSPSILLAPSNRLKAVWLLGEPGELLFGQADVDLAAIEAEWSIPVKLPLVRDAATSPDIAGDQDGNLYVAYAISLNEDRGIYLTVSLDGGESWTDSSQVFDAAGAGWEMVGKPKIAVGDDGTLHMMWVRYGSPPSPVPLSVHYARSVDGGLTWTDASLVAEGEIRWAKPLAIGNGLVHRLWHPAGSGIWHDTSFDSGKGWEQIRRVPGNQSDFSALDAVVDPSMQIQLVAIDVEEQLSERTRAILRHWSYADDRWEVKESLEVIGTKIDELATTVTSDGQLAVLYGTVFDGEVDSLPIKEIYSSLRGLNLPVASPTPLPTWTPPPPPPPTAIPTQMPEATPTIFFPLEEDQGGGLPIPINSTSPFVGPLLGIIPAALLIVVAFFVIVRIIRADRR